MMGEYIDEILQKAYTKNWDDFFIIGVLFHSLGVFIIFYGWFKMPVLIHYLLYLPLQILGSIALIIYMIFTKSKTIGKI